MTNTAEALPLVVVIPGTIGLLTTWALLRWAEATRRDVAAIRARLGADQAGQS